MKRFARENSLSLSLSLSLFFLTIFLLALGGQAIAGHNLYNEGALAHQESQIGLWSYLTSSSFGQAVMENWQSEYLQFALFALASARSRSSPSICASGARRSRSRSALRPRTRPGRRGDRDGELSPPCSGRVSTGSPLGKSSACCRGGRKWEPRRRLRERRPRSPAPFRLCGRFAAVARLRWIPGSFVFAEGSRGFAGRPLG